MRYLVHKPLQATGTVESRSVSNHRFLKLPEFSNQFSVPLDILLSNGLNFTLDFSNPLISRQFLFPLEVSGILLYTGG